MNKKVVRKTDSLENVSSRITKLPDQEWGKFDVKNPSFSVDNIKLKFSKLKTLTVDRIRITLPALFLITISIVSIASLIGLGVFFGTN